MKKLGKVLLMSVIAFMMMFCVAQPTTFAIYYEGSTPKSSIPDSPTSSSSKSESYTSPSAAKAQSALDEIEGKIKDDKTDTSAASSIGAKIFSWIWVISIIVAVIVLAIIGLKFILGSVQEKAEYKKSLIPVAVGALVIVFATTIVRVIFSL